MNDMIKKLVDIDEQAKSYSEETKKETARICASSSCFAKRKIVF